MAFIIYLHEYGVRGGRQAGKRTVAASMESSRDNCWLLDPVFSTGDHGQKPIAVLAGGLLLMPMHGTLLHSFLCLATCPTVIQ